MKIFRIIFFLPLIFISSAFSQHLQTDVFVSGTGGYNTFRIPAIIKLADGKLLAFCEGRVKSSSDFGNVDIVMKESSDNGKTWSALRKIIDVDSLQAGNCAPVVDLHDTNYPEGRIFLFFNTGNNHESEVRKGNGIREAWYITCADGGASWSDRVNITDQVQKPNMPAFNPAYNYKEDWRSYANTPGHAMQFQTGKFKGRIFVAANHSADNPKPKFKDYSAHGYYTDDHGKNFHLSDDVNLPGSNESTAAELSDGRMMMNSRNQSGEVKARIVSISYDGGATWDTTYFDKNLPDPVCEGSLLTIGTENGKSILAFCNPADTSSRNNLTLRISFDEGKTWKQNFLIDSSPADYKGDFTAYSDIVKLSDSEIGVLYEKENYSRIVFTVFKWR